MHALSRKLRSRTRQRRQHRHSGASDFTLRFERAAYLVSPSQPTNLYPLRKAVDDENRREFEKLKEQAYTFQALDDSRGAYAESVLGERVRQPLSVKTRD